MTVSLIAAMSRNRVIGKDGALPWNIPADKSRFRELTVGHTVIMGRKTFESIGRPLPGRKNIVLTRQPDLAPAGTIVTGSLDAALQLAEGDSEVFICGGGHVYAQALPLAEKIYLTVVDLDIEGDVLFPCLDMEDFEEVARESISFAPPADFIVMTRKTPAGTANAL